MWPDFWTLLEDSIRSGLVYSCEKVYEEWVRQEDELAAWVRALGQYGLACPAGEGTNLRYREIVNQVYEEYEERHANHFLSGADPWVIAQALADGSRLVTFEKALSPGARKVKIPNVCKRFGVRCINTYDMVRELRSRG